MHPSLLKILVDPVSGEPLDLAAETVPDGGEILSGILRSPSGESWEIIDGIPRFIAIEDAGQKQTSDSFGFKWRQRSTYDSPAMRSLSADWVLSRYGFETIEEMRRFFSERRRILDAGCGAGYTSSLWMDPSWRNGNTPDWVGVDISSAVDVARERLGHIPGTDFVQADLLNLPFAAGSFDAIFSEGVLHHTPSTETAFLRIAKLLASGGEFLLYVYRKKAPIREFADDYIRGILSKLDPDTAWKTLGPVTKLGQALAELRATVIVPEDIPILGIKAGEHDVQRLLYWHFLKLFWNERLTFEENNHINFDWYHPTYAHRHTEGEIRSWCANAGLSVSRFYADEPGFTVRARKL